MLVFSQNREKAFQINQKLGRGINYGNIFEAPSEQAWGNPWKPQYAGMIADLGFNHIRIPIRWEPADRSSAVEPYTINPNFLSRIKMVVDSIINNGMSAIVNMHHHEALYEDPAGNKSRFLAQWKQISEYFKDYPDELLFEILNEPHGNLSAEIWNVFLAEAIDTIRVTNPERIVLIGAAEYGGLGGLSKLQIPDDEYLILTIHYYNPFQFTHQGAGWVGEQSNAWLGTQWNDSETERKIVQNEFAPLYQIGQQLKLPIHIGEFGAYEKADMTSRAKWTTYLARYMESLNWSWAYWEFSAGFGIYDKNRLRYNQELVDALLHNQMPEPARYIGTPVYTSNFLASNDGWSLSASNGGSANLTRQNETLKANISSGGSQSWHVQLRKGGFALKQGKKYRFSFKAKAANNRSATTYIGMNASPWSAYSGYNGFNLTDSFAVYTFIFDMQSTDNNARMVFDLGNSSADFEVKEIIVEEIVLQWPTYNYELNEIKSAVYPIPGKTVVTIINSDNFERFEMLNIHGGIVKSGLLHPDKNSLNVTDVPSGMYFLQLSTGIQKSTFKWIKQ